MYVIEINKRIVKFDETKILVHKYYKQIVQLLR